MKKETLKCWCKKCGKQLKTKREYINQEDTCDDCFKEIAEERCLNCKKEGKLTETCDKCEFQ